MSTKQIKIILGILVFISLFLFPETVFAQGCSMCKATAESNIQGGGTEASGLNAGILFILIFPYIFFTIFFIYWKKHRQELRDEEIDLQR